MKLRELSLLEGRTITMVPSDKRIEIIGMAADEPGAVHRSESLVFEQHHTVARRAMPNLLKC